MKLKKTLTYQNRAYSFLSDNTNEVLENPEEILFVKTPLNEKYAPLIAEKTWLFWILTNLKTTLILRLRL